MKLLQPEHILLIVFAMLLLFGGKKVPELMKGLGTGIKEFKDAQNGISPESKIVAEKAKDGPESV